MLIRVLYCGTPDTGNYGGTEEARHILLSPLVIYFRTER
jgi:hypothetical protein